MNRTSHNTRPARQVHRGWLAGTIFFLLVFFFCAHAEAQTQMRFTRYAAVSHNVGDLRWINYPAATGYSLYRHFPSQVGFSLIASIADTHYLDTIRRAVCDDTVSYYVEAITPWRTYRSNTVGVHYVDDVPTEPCALRLCTVDTVIDRIRLTWYPTPDTDAIGYYICVGSPCIDYDTIWGRMSTTYLCPELLDPKEQYRFRVLAFDSCYQASPLTPSYYNPVLHFADTGCSRHFHCTWEPYINMPDGVGRYRLYYRLEGQDTTYVFESGPDGPYEFDTVINDLQISSVSTYLRVDNVPDTLHAFSHVYTYDFFYGDTAEYLRITDVVYDENVPSIALTIDIDTDFSDPRCYVFRSQGEEENFMQIATIERVDTSQQYLYFTDESINRAAGRYVYRVGVHDKCQFWVKYSDTVQILLPEVFDPTGYFPNAIIYGHPECGKFCPLYLSPLSIDYQLDIFTRWGQRVFHTTNIGDCWDGTDYTGQPLHQGAYVYRAQVHHADGTVQVYKGTVVLIR